VGQLEGSAASILLPRKRGERELPGISPRILQYLLDSTVFLTLRDLGFPMPPYDETAIEIDMRPEQAGAYRELEEALAPSLRNAGAVRRPLGAPNTLVHEVGETDTDGPDF
jgi:hypothetical protein